MCRERVLGAPERDPAHPLRARPPRTPGAGHPARRAAARRAPLRVLRPGGVLAFWTYGNCLVSPAVDRHVADFSRDVVGPYWPRERRHVEEGYRDLVVAWPAIETPPFAMHTRWDAAAMLGYLDTWSSVRRCRLRSGRDPLGVLAGPLSAAWGEGPRDMRWPLAVRAHRN